MIAKLFYGYGIQEESTVLKIPCYTLRYNTERPITITQAQID